MFSLFSILPWISIWSQSHGTHLEAFSTATPWVLRTPFSSTFSHFLTHQTPFSFFAFSLSCKILSNFTFKAIPPFSCGGPHHHLHSSISVHVFRLTATLFISNALSVHLRYSSPLLIPAALWRHGSGSLILILRSFTSAALCFHPMWFACLHQICISCRIQLIIFKLAFPATATACLHDLCLHHVSLPWLGSGFALSWFWSQLHRLQILVHYWFCFVFFFVGCWRSLIWSFRSICFISILLLCCQRHFSDLAVVLHLISAMSGCLWALLILDQRINFRLVIVQLLC